MSDVSVAEPETTPRPLPKGWQWVKLGDVCDVVSGSTPNTSVADYWNGDIPWVTPTDLGKLSKPVLLNTHRNITPEGLKSCSARIVPKGTVLMSSRAPIGHLAVAEIECCTNQGCKNFIPSQDVDSWYLYYALKISVPKFQELGSGATFAEVSKTAVEAFKIPLPPLSEQKRIAGILNEQVAAIERARAATEAQLEAAKALPAAYLREVFDSEEAKKWPKKRLGDLSHRISKGESPAWQGFDYLKEGVLFIRSENVRWGTFTKEPRICIPEEFHAKLSRSSVKENDVLVNLVGASIGRACVAPTGIGNANVNQAVAVTTCTEALLPSYLVYYVIAPQTQRHFDDVQVEMARPNISLENLRELPIPLPSLQKQKRITNILNEQMQTANNVRRALEEELDTINKLPAALLRRAFNGEL